LCGVAEVKRQKPAFPGLEDGDMRAAASADFEPEKSIAAVAGHRIGRPESPSELFDFRSKMLEVLIRMRSPLLELIAGPDLAPSPLRLRSEDDF